MIYKTIRQQIINGELGTVFTSLNSILKDDEKKRDLALQQFRLNNIKKQEIMGVNVDNVERNKIIYHLLNIITDLEKSQTKEEQELAKLVELAHYEDLLSKGYHKLQIIEEQNPIYGYLTWLKNNNSNALNVVLKNNLNEAKIIHLLNINLIGFMAHHGIDATFEDVYQYLYQKLSANPQIISEWQQKIDKIQNAITIVEQKYMSLLKYFGVTLAGVLLGLFIAEINDEDEDDDDED